MSKIKKAVIAVAGFGTRFLPATKVLPKELIPIVDKPIVHYLVEEAVESGIEDIILVTRSGTQAIADYFDTSADVEVQLSEQGKDDLLQMVQRIPQMASFASVRQAKHLPYGNGSPLLAAKDFIDRDEPFVYMFGDDMVMADTPGVKQLIEAYEETQPSAVVAVQNVPREETSRYGIVKTKANVAPPEMETIVEKPDPDAAPSTLAQFGRFILTPRVIEILERRELGKGNELWLADALAKLSRESRVVVQEIQGTWYTTGDPLRFLITSIEYAVRHPEIGEAFAAYLRDWQNTKPEPR